MSIDFISLGNIIFKDKDKYQFITNEDKEKNFFILNRKFAYKDIKKAQFFNNKNIDKSSSLDIWFSLFNNTTNIPSWYWQTKANKTTKAKPKFKKDEVDDIIERYDLSDKDIDFLILYYEEEMKETIKRLKKFQKK